MMSCYHPITAYQDDSGRIAFVDNGGREFRLPCGHCIGCRIDRSRDWAVRCVHEAQMHDENVFITLTYDAKHLPPDCGLLPRDFTLFMKRLRKKFRNKKIRYFMCGEYGEKNNRPHYHAVLFGLNFNDWVYLFDSPGGNEIYTSPTLEEIWGQGFVTVGTVTFESAAYVARYILKKINGPLAEEINKETGLKHYERVNSFTGEIVSVLPEYCRMSNRSGIGSTWISNFRRDVYPKGFTTIAGKRVKPPRYYDKYLNNIDPDLYDDIKAGRELSLAHNFADNTKSRLAAKETVKEAQNKRLKRNL